MISISLFSIALLNQVITYIKSKPLGEQQVTDLIYKDLAISLIVATNCFCHQNTTRLLFGPCPIWVADFKIFLSVFATGTYVLFILASVIMRYFLIFYYSEVNLLQDSKLHFFVRSLVISTSLICVTIAYVKNGFLARNAQFLWQIGQTKDSSFQSKTSPVLGIMIMFSITTSLIIYGITEIRKKLDKVIKLYDVAQEV